MTQNGHGPPSQGVPVKGRSGAVSRRNVISGLAALAPACRGEEDPGAAARSRPQPMIDENPDTAGRMPSLFIPHGGGPWPWTPAFTPSLATDYEQLRAYLESIAGSLPRRPTGILVVSAHWEAPVPTLTVSERPPMVYDYSGFPADTYRIQWRAPGSPKLAAKAQQLLAGAGIETAADPSRGFDHGTFVPMKLAFPDADIPTVQLSLDASYDAGRHLAMGRALAPLRDEGVLIVGSGMTWEDFRAGNIAQRSSAFRDWLQSAATADSHTRESALRNWMAAPYARIAHPHEEHLLPMMVAAGAAGDDRGKIAWTGSLLGISLSAVAFGTAEIS